jgi:hypothetical protein
MTLKLAAAQLDSVAGDLDGPFTGAFDDAVKADLRDGILARYMQDDEGIFEVERDARLVKINEYRGRQAPVGIRVTHRSFGKDWRYPITSKFNETAGAQKP